MAVPILLVAGMTQLAPLLKQLGLMDTGAEGATEAQARIMGTPDDIKMMAYADAAIGFKGSRAEQEFSGTQAYADNVFKAYVMNRVLAYRRLAEQGISPDKWKTLYENNSVYSSATGSYVTGDSIVDPNKAKEGGAWWVGNTPPQYFFDRNYSKIQADNITSQQMAEGIGGYLTSVSPTFQSLYGYSLVDTGVPANSSSGGGGGGGFNYTGGGGFGGRSSIQPYPGYNKSGGASLVGVNLTPGQKAAQDLATALLSGKEGTFREDLSGKPNLERLEAVLSPLRRELREIIIPQIEDAFTGGAYGASYNSGARQKAIVKAQQNLLDTEAKARYQESVDAKTRALQSIQQIPGLTQTAGLSQANRIGNIERDMKRWYADMGLSADVYKADLQAAIAAAEVGARYAAIAQQQASDQLRYQMEQQKLSLDRQQMLFNQTQATNAWNFQQDQIGQANKAGLYGLMGLGLGALAGWGTPNAASYALLGSAAGQSLAGSPTTGYSNAVSGIQLYRPDLSSAITSGGYSSLYSDDPWDKGGMLTWDNNTNSGSWRPSLNFN